MSWEDKDIDKLFRESANQVNVPFQDSFWDEMEAMLPQKKKKKGFFWIFGASFTVIAFVIAGTLLYPTHQVASEKSTRAPRPFSTNHAAAPIAQTTSLEALEAREMTNAAAFADQESTNLSASERTPKSKKERQNKTINSLYDQPAPDQSIDATDHLVTKTVPTTVPNPFANQSEEETRLPFRSLATKLGLAPFRNVDLSLKNRKNNPWFLQFNAGISQAYLREASQIAPTFSVGIGYQIRSSQLAFSAGLQLQNMLINSLEITRTSRVYNFASTNYKQEIQIKQLYTLEVPLAVSLIKNRHAFSLGVTPGYLLTSVVKVREFENELLQEQNNYLGQRIGLKSFSLKPTLGYQLAVNKSWHVGIHVQTQLFGQLDMNQFAGDERKFPLVGQLTIRKTLF